MTNQLGKQPPTLPAGFFGGHLIQMRRSPLDFLTKAGTLGDISRFRFGKQPMFFVNQPDLIRDVLVVNHHKFYKGMALQRMKPLFREGLLTSEGKFHLRQRRMIQPAFHRQRIAGYAATMINFGEKVSSQWQTGKIVDVDAEMMRLTLFIVAKTLYDADVENEADEIGAAITTMLKLFNYLLLPFGEQLMRLPIPPARRFQRAKETVDRVIYEIIKTRRALKEDKGDLLSMLLLAVDEADGGAMTDEQVRDEALTLFLAGHETTANALTWTWYFLSQNRRAEQQLHDEIDSVFPQKRLPAFEDYSKLKYTEAVLAESMRLFPPAWAIGRTAIESHVLKDFEIPAGSIVLMSPFVTQRDTRFWSNAAEFQPERWLAHENAIKEAAQKFTYFPFGGGVRRCIGESFAWTEGVLLLATIARNWRLKLLPSQKIAPKPMVTLRPKFGMKMTVEKR
jgi:cytochrome P450